jgi:tRNA(Arg) A34 adenosine deaminase TadA
MTRACWTAGRTDRRMRDRFLTPAEMYSDPKVLFVDGRDARWLERAIRVARTVDGRWKVGCVIVRGSRLLAAAANVERNDPAVLGGHLWHASVHAEIAALRLAGEARGATAYVARVGRDGSVRHAQPCARCQATLEESGVRAVWSSDPGYVTARRVK